jgi:hypothetical protein
MHRVMDEVVVVVVVEGVNWSRGTDGNNETWLEGGFDAMQRLTATFRVPEEHVRIC